MTSSKHPNIEQDLTLARALSWLGSAAAFSWPLITWVALWPLITGSTGGQIPGSELPIDIHLYDLLIGVIPAAVLVGSRYLFRANRPGEFSGSTIKNASVQVLAAIIGVSLTFVIVSSAGTIPVAYLVGAPVAVLSTWGQIFGFTVITIAIAEFRAATKKLARKTHRLEFLKANLERRVIEQREALQLEVESRMSEQVNDLREQLNALKSSANQDEKAAQLATNISSTIDDIVRPLSLDIANSANKDTRAEVRTLRQVERQISRLSFGQRMGLRVNLSSVFNATFATIFLLVFMVPTYGYLFGALAMFQVAVPATLLSCLLVWLARRLTSRVRATYGLALLAVLLGAFFGAIPFAILSRLLLSDQDAQLVDFSVFGVFLVTVFVFYGSLFYQAAYQILDRVKEANLELRKLVAFLQNEFQVNRRNLAQVVHGKIQARLQAASIRLKQADAVTDQLIAAIQDDLNGALLESAGAGITAQPVEALLSEMAEQWSGICDLTFSFDGSVAGVVNASQVLKVAVVEVVREAVNNAVKHSDADEADIAISSKDPDSVTIEIRNAVYSRAATPGNKGRGYGSQLLDQITDSWSVVFEDDDAIFKATIRVSGISL
jgi:hypothetical protein